jgi:hypothetical protein
MDDISPDDIIENTALLNELQEWIWERRERVSPDKMAYLLLVVASEIAERHIIKKERIKGLIDAAVQIGRIWGRER